MAKQDEGQSYGSQGPRTGTMTPSGSSCTFHLAKYYIVRGATVAYYVDPSKSMSVDMPVASGSSPGSEDWDNDGHAGITMTVTGIANGDIYAAQRDFSEYNGTVPQNAKAFEVGVVGSDGKPALAPEQYALNPTPYGNGCSGLCTLSATVDQCPAASAGGCAAEFFVDWVRLASPPGANDTAICKAVVSQAPTIAPRAVDVHPAPTGAKYP
jgi:hypothetical protein